jgi:hypothetical protein
MVNTSLPERVNDPCFKCGETKVVYKIKLRFLNNETNYGPKYEPMISKNCAGCKRWFKWEKQSPELINELNTILEEIEL